MTQSTSTEIDLVGKAVERLQSDKPVSMTDLLKVLRPDPVGPEKVSEKVPAPAAITKEQRAALERVMEVFGQVVPTERRALQPAEVSSLLEEKRVLAEVEKMAKKRVESIRTTVYNHLDVEAEQDDSFDAEHTLKDKDGHYILKGEARGTENDGEKFARETREGSPTLDVEALKALADDPDFEGLDHKTYLSMTTQTRVVDEAKVMLALKKDPSLVSAIARASKPGNLTSSFNVRKA